MTMLKTLKNIQAQECGNPIEGETFLLKEECANDYYIEVLPTIPAGTEILAGIAGDFGMYGLVEIDGVLHKVKINLGELHKIDFGPFDARKPMHEPA
jgi:hypothetical protein